MRACLHQVFPHNDERGDLSAAPLGCVVGSVGCYQVLEEPVAAGQPVCVAPTVVQVRVTVPLAARVMLNVSFVVGAVAVTVYWVAEGTETPPGETTYALPAGADPTWIVDS